jgi:hypothetical protein
MIPLVRFRAAFYVGLAGASLALALPAGVQAAFPGANGRIAYSWFSSQGGVPGD